MIRLACTLALLASTLPSIAHGQAHQCPRVDSCHGLGQMAMSAQGDFMAFTLLGTPATRMMIVELEARRAIVVEAPEQHRTLGHPVWSPDGDELTFVTAEGSVLGNEGSDVWRWSPLSPTTVDWLAHIPHVSRPVLSADGRTLAVFEGVAAGAPPHTSSSFAFALFERAVENGLPTRRSDGQMQWPPTLHYDRAGALVLGGILQPVFRHTLVSNGREHPYWGDGDENGRSRWQWLRDTNNVFAFRLAPGETLPAWPTPFPASGALQGATAVRPTNDGRVIVRASLSGANWTDWYDERGRPRQPTRQLRSGYLVYSADGRSELVNTPNLPVGVGTTGGSDISEDGRRFAWVLSRNLPRGIRPANEAWDHRHTLQVFENGELIFERPTSELAANAATIRASLEGAPIMPTTSLEGRLTAEGPEEGLRSSP